MGLFGGLFKLVKGVVKGGLNVVTHGASNKIFSALKGRGAVKQVANTPDLTAQQLAIINKLGPPLSPKLSSTEHYLRQVAERAGGSGAHSEKRMPAPYRKPRRPRYSAPAPVAPAKAHTRRKAARTGAKRPPPIGGLDLKGLSVSWRAAGKPGTWQGWIAAHK